MAGPLLETKLHVPAATGALVDRTRLTQRLRQGSRSAVTLVSAPAGFGKSTLMAELARGRGEAGVAWVSLDAGDSDPSTFWTYVITALERAARGVGGAGGATVEDLGDTVKGVLTAVLNALAASGAEVILVLDDFHAVESPAISAQVGWFLERLPPNLHVVIGTRADPAIPLARLRARGALTEIRAGDLRFTPDEAAEYLRARMGLQLSAEDVATLESRTEGWIAALQLAAISLRGRSDASSFIAAFAGDDRYIVDYLVEEVLRVQPADVRDFLLRTSVLSRISGALADAVTGRRDGRATLEALDRSNLFLVPLDDQRRWYRYHHLFGGVLQAYLATELPDEQDSLHGRASAWFERNGDRPEAIRHALASRDYGRAADLVELAAPELGRLRREPTMRRWMDALPDEVVRLRPVLSTAYAGVLLSSGETEGVDALLTQAERWLDLPSGQRAAAGMVVTDQAEFEHLPAAIELFRAALAKAGGDMAGNLQHARRVLEIVEESDHARRGGAASFLGLASWGAGDLESGYRWFAEGMASIGLSGRLADVVGGSIVLADIRMAQARLGDARALYEEGLRLATAGGGTLRGVTDMHTGLAEVGYERGDLAGARAHLDEGRRLGEELGFPREPYRRRVVEARMLQAEGDLPRALELLDAAERRYLSDYSPNVRPIPALRARLQVAHGELPAPRRWADERGLATTNEVSYLREYEHLALARLLIAEHGAGGGGLSTALELIERLLAAATEGRRDGSRLAILVVQALGLHARGDVAGAVAALSSAAALAEPDGWVRIFLDEGPAMTALLREAGSRGGHPYLAQLQRVAPPPSRGRRPAMHGLIEPLSDRELDVLRLLRSDLSGPDMARELVVSVNTLRTHTKNIYAKLGVTSRRAAIRRGEELGLL